MERSGTFVARSAREVPARSVFDGGAHESLPEPRGGTDGVAGGFRTVARYNVDNFDDFASGAVCQLELVGSGREKRLTSDPETWTSLR